MPGSMRRLIIKARVSPERSRSRRIQSGVGVARMTALAQLLIVTGLALRLTDAGRFDPVRGTEVPGVRHWNHMASVAEFAGMTAIALRLGPEGVRPVFSEPRHRVRNGCRVAPLAPCSRVTPRTRAKVTHAMQGTPVLAVGLGERALTDPLAAGHVLHVACRTVKGKPAQAVAAEAQLHRVRRRRAGSALGMTRHAMAVGTRHSLGEGLDMAHPQPVRLNGSVGQTLMAGDTPARVDRRWRTTAGQQSPRDHRRDPHPHGKDATQPGSPVAADACDPCVGVLLRRVRGLPVAGTACLERCCPHGSDQNHEGRDKRGSHSY